MQRAASSLIRQAARSARLAGYEVQATRCLATAVPRFATETKLPGKGSKPVKSQLLQKVESEIKGEAGLEKETPNDERIAALKKQGVWQIEETDGSNLVTLSRQYNGETIRVTFACQISDYTRGMADEDDDAEEDDDDEPDDEQREEEDEEGGDDDFDDENDVEESSIVVSVDAGPGKSLLVADIVLDPAQMEVEGVRILPSGTKVDPASLRTLDAYHGPDYSMLDPEVTEEFEKWFADRGIASDQLADHVADVKAWKEQKEYIRWLNDLRTFLK